MHNYWLNGLDSLEALGAKVRTSNSAKTFAVRVPATIEPLYLDLLFFIYEVN